MKKVKEKVKEKLKEQVKQEQPNKYKRLRVEKTWTVKYMKEEIKLWENEIKDLLKGNVETVMKNLSKINELRLRINRQNTKIKNVKEGKPLYGYKEAGFFINTIDPEE